MVYTTISLWLTRSSIWDGRLPLDNVIAHKFVDVKTGELMRHVTVTCSHVYSYLLRIGSLNVDFHRAPLPSRRVFRLLNASSPLRTTLPMAFIDFSQQSSLFNQPHHPNRLSDFLTGSTTRLAYDGDPSDDLEEHSVFIDIEDFMKSVLHVPADWRARWGPAIRAVKHNPDFMKHYLRYPVPHEKDCAEHEEEYEPLLLMNEAILRTAFPTVLSQQATPTPLPLSQLVHIVDDGPYDCIVDDGSFIPRLITEGKVSGFPAFAPV